MNCNIIETIIDLCIESGKSLYNILSNKKSFDFNKYFEIIGFYTEVNGVKQKPKLLANYNTEQGEKYIFTVPVGYSVLNINSYKSGMELYIGHKLDFTFEGKNWVIEVIKNNLETRIQYNEPLFNFDTIKIPIGISLKGVEYLDLKEEPNTFIVGTTGSGKSVCVKSIICSIVNNYSPSQCELYLADLKRVELSLFSNLEHTKKFVYKLEDVTQLIIDVFNKCEERYDLFLNNNVTSIFEYNKIKKDKLPFIILFIEEVVLLLQDKKKIAMDTLKELTSICRASGIYVFMSTQRPSADVIDTVVKASINNRICFRVEDSKNSVIALDCECAETIKYKGRGYYKNMNGITEFQGYYISDKQVNTIIDKYKTKEVLKASSKQLGFVDNSVEDLSFLDKL